MIDTDLLSIQEARTLVRSARDAMAGLAELDQKAIDTLVAAISAGCARQAGSGYVIERLYIPNIDTQVFAALSGSVTLPEDQGRALGIVETFSATPIIEAADAAVKAADVVLYRVHVSMAIGGKGYFLVNGYVSAVAAAVEAAVEKVRESGMLVNRVVIPAASKEIFQEYV